MPRNSTGVYTPPADTDAIDGEIISADAYNTLQGDQAAELTNSLDRLGRGAMLADLPMGGFKVTEMANPAAATDGVNKQYADANYLSSANNAVTNAKLALAPLKTIKGTVAGNPSSSATVTITIATPGVFTWTAHGLADNAPVVLTTTGALPGGLVQNIIYYVVASTKTANTFTLSATPGGASIATTGTQSGVHTAATYAQSFVRDIPFDYFGQWLTDAIALPSVAIGTVVTNDTVTPDTKIKITAVAAVLGNLAGGNVRRSSVNVTINATTVGANGLQSGTLAANTWYYAYLIDNGTAIAGFLSTSSTSPTLPSGYKYFLRVGAAKTDGTSKFYRFLQVGNDFQWTITATTNTTAPPAISTGDIGTVDPTTPTYVSRTIRAASGAFPLACVPPTAAKAWINAWHLFGAGGLTMVAPTSAYGGYSSITNAPPLIAGSSTSMTSALVLSSNEIYIACNGGAGVSAVFCPGFTDTAAVI